MEDLVSFYGISNETVIRKSQELDRYINLYYKLTKLNKAAGIIKIKNHKKCKVKGSKRLSPRVLVNVSI
jgi:hypothetical protein